MRHNWNALTPEICAFVLISLKNLLFAVNNELMREKMGLEHNFP